MSIGNRKSNTTTMVTKPPLFESEANSDATPRNSSLPSSRQIPSPLFLVSHLWKKSLAHDGAPFMRPLLGLGPITLSSPLCSELDSVSIPASISWVCFTSWVWSVTHYVLILIIHIKFNGSDLSLSLSQLITPLTLPIYIYGAKCCIYKG